MNGARCASSRRRPGCRPRPRACRAGWSSTAVPTAAFGYDASVTPYPYDPDRAKELLAEAGYPNGFSVEFDSFTGSIADHSRPAEAIVEYLRQVGIDHRADEDVGGHWPLCTGGARSVQGVAWVDSATEARNNLW